MTPTRQNPVFIIWNALFVFGREVNVVRMNYVMVNTTAARTEPIFPAFSSWKIIGGPTEVDFDPLFPLSLILLTFLH